MNRSERFSTRYKPYLWVLGEGVETLPVNEMVDQRYQVVAPRIWLDTCPHQRPAAPDTLPPEIQPYLKAHPHRLHVPGVYSILSGPGAGPMILLENGPIHPQSGDLFPTLEAAWGETRPLRQMHWLWQMWELWPTLAALGVAASLLDLGNVHTEGWRIRLRELLPDHGDTPSIQALATVWQPLVETAHPDLMPALDSWMQELRAIGAGDQPVTAEIDALTARFNHLLLTQAAQMSVRMTVVGATTPGPQQPRNEDTCYPNGAEDPEAGTTLPRVAMICDGVGGHAGGEVASQLAVQSLHLQLRGLLAEAYDESQVLPPQVIGQQLEAAIRIVNDVISNQNDAQGREERQRMGTTLALALVVPQRIQTEEGWERVDEIYIAHVGDSRAYWITPDYCHLLTVDHDIAGREVQACRQLLPIAQERPDAGALTQAIGTRGNAYLHPFIQRFLVDETGVLLLCSDGLSDNHRIEDAWANYIGLIVKDIVSLDAAVASWIELANQKNGHDNTSVVLMYCKVVGRAALVSSLTAQQEMPAQEIGSMAPALLYGESPEDMAGEMGKPIRDRRLWPIFAAIAALILMAGGGVVWWFLTQRSPTPVPPPSAPELEQTP